MDNIEDDDYQEESFEDCFFSRLIFAQALDSLLGPGRGIFLELYGEALELGFQRVIVFNNHETRQLDILIADERTDLKHGDRIICINEDLIKN